MQSYKILPQIAGLLEWWLSEIKACLGSKIHSVVLYGSAAIDDFCPRWSDIDVCVVLRTPIAQAEGKSVGGVHDRMQNRFITGGVDGWISGQAVEGSYIPIELAGDEDVQKPCYTAGGMTRKWAVCHPVSPFDRYMLAHFSRMLLGDYISFKPPSEASLVTQAQADLRTFLAWDPYEQSAISLAGMLHWTARSLIFWRDGTMLSKSAALEHEIAHSSPFAPAFQMALNIRRKGSVAAKSYHQALKAYYREIAQDLAFELEKSLKIYSPRPEDSGNRQG